MYRNLAICLLAACLFLCVSSLPQQQTLLTPSDPHVANSWSWSDCGEVTDIVEIKSLEISPDPPKPGDELTVTASGYVSSTIKAGAWADVTIKLGLIKIIASFDICEEASKANATLQCPVKPGDYVVVQKVTLPQEIPRAKVNIDVKAFNDDEANILCAKITMDFTTGLK